MVVQSGASTAAYMPIQGPWFGPRPGHQAFYPSRIGELVEGIKQLQVSPKKII